MLRVLVATTLLSLGSTTLFGDGLPTHGEWLYEIKWDGYRALAVKNSEGAELYSRRSNIITGNFTEVAEAVARIPGKSFVLDGEIVALDAQGRASFQLMQNFQQAHAIRYYLFDIACTIARFATF